MTIVVLLRFYRLLARYHQQHKVYEVLFCVTDYINCGLLLLGRLSFRLSLPDGLSTNTEGVRSTYQITSFFTMGAILCRPRINAGSLLSDNKSFFLTILIQYFPFLLKIPIFSLLSCFIQYFFLCSPSSITTYFCEHFQILFRISLFYLHSNFRFSLYYLPMKTSFTIFLLSWLFLFSFFSLHFHLL